MTDPTDWLAYLEATPHTEPYQSIAKAWRIDRRNLSLAEEGRANYAQEMQQLKKLAVEMADTLRLVEWDCDPPKRVTDMLEQAEKLRPEPQPGEQSSQA